MSDAFPPVEPKLHPNLAQYRERYPILSHTTYLNSNSMGAMPVTAAAALEEYAAVWREQGVEAWNTWVDVIDEVADSVGRMFGAGPGETTLNQNVAFFQGQIASCLDFSGSRNKVVIEELMFPNVVYVWERYKDLGAKLELVPSDDGMNISLERTLAAIDESTAIVSISHAVYVSGALMDIKAIAERAHEVGALCMLDAYQTLGVVPIDVYDLGIDILVGGSHKWLCSGPGTGFMWVHPEVAPTLDPRSTGWWAHREPFAFEPAPIDYATGSWRFMGGTPSMPAYYVAREAYKDLHEVGVETIRQHNAALCQVIIDRAQAAGLTIHSPLEHHLRTGFVAVDFPNSQVVSRQLIADQYKHDWRPGCGLRLGPHFYNTEQEVHRFMDRVIELAQPG